MADTFLGYGKLGASFYMCGDCRGWFSQELMRPNINRQGMGMVRMPRPTPGLSAKVERRKPCVCGPKIPRTASRSSSASTTRRAAATQQTSPPGGSLPADLAALAKLWESGALTDQEFAAAKARLLGTTTSETAVNQSSATGRRPTAPPGWYRDPSGGSNQDRYWNGTEWTEFTQQRAEASSAPLTSGSRVAHPTFGDGTIVEVHDREVLVNFDRFGRKWLATDYAKLRPLS